MMTFLLLSSWSFETTSQELSYAEQLDLLESELDSMGVFNLFDSILSTTELQIPNELNFRFSYTDNVTSAGRDFNLDQSGLSPGIAYYHRSGFYGDLAGYWNSGVTPNYNPTILTIGYLGNKKRWVYSMDYERWFYNPKDSLVSDLTNSIGGYGGYNWNNFTLGIDYSFLFGQNDAHRILGIISYSLPLRGFWKFKNVNLFPTFNILFGNSELTTMRIATNQLPESIINYAERLLTIANATEEEKRNWTRQAIVAYRNGRISEEQRNSLINIIQTGSSLTQQDIETFRQLLKTGEYTREFFYTDEAFGLLNYTFTIPLSLSTNRLSILISYTYNLPVKLPEEVFEVDPSGYFGASVLYRIPFK